MFFFKDPCEDYNLTCQKGAVCVPEGWPPKRSCSCVDECANVRKRPICGTDGKDYLSICHMKLQACKNLYNPDIFVQVRAKCGKYIKMRENIKFILYFIFQKYMTIVTTSISCFAHLVEERIVLTFQNNHK